LISNQLDELCKPTVRQNIHVFAFYDYFKGLVDVFGPRAYLTQLRELAKGHTHEQDIIRTIDSVKPETFAREQDPLSREDLKDTWNLFIDQPAVQTFLTYFRDHLEKHQWNIDAEAYLNEELSLVRSAFATGSRSKEYESMNRIGRAIAFPLPVRKQVMEALLLFEETMLHGGMLDVLSLSAALLPHVLQIRDIPSEKRFRCLLIDEFQDFSTLDLSLLRRVPLTLEPNGLFLTGDPVQRVLVKDLRLAAVGLDILSAQWARITKNYRNSRQILEAAHLLAKEYGTKARQQGEEIEILDPQLAVRETARPIAARVSDENQVAAAWRIVRECLDNKSALAWSVTISTASPMTIDTDSIIAGKPSDFPYKVDELSGDYTEQRDTVTVANLADLKGFEFSLVIIVGCGKE
jgi:superfamily I DNA/RNA helicase